VRPRAYEEAQEVTVHLPERQSKWREAVRELIVTLDRPQRLGGTDAD